MNLLFAAVYNDVCLCKGVVPESTYAVRPVNVYAYTCDMKKVASFYNMFGLGCVCKCL